MVKCECTKACGILGRAKKYRITDLSAAVDVYGEWVDAAGMLSLFLFANIDVVSSSELTGTAIIEL